MNPSTQDMMECISKLNAEHIFILPNNKNIIMAANQAAEIADKDVRVIPTKSIPQGITSITMFNPEQDVDSNEASMMEALDMVKTGSVTYAVRDTEMDGIEIKEGNMLGLVEGKIKKVGEDYFEVAKEILETVTESCTMRLYYLALREADKIAEAVKSSGGLYGRQKEMIEKYIEYSEIELL
jgi:dihydroxyacetone kinase-like predicted kinase